MSLNGRIPVGFKKKERERRRKCEL